MQQPLPAMLAHSAALADGSTPASASPATHAGDRTRGLLQAALALLMPGAGGAAGSSSAPAMADLHALAAFTAAATAAAAAAGAGAGPGPKAQQQQQQLGALCGTGSAQQLQLVAAAFAAGAAAGAAGSAAASPLLAPALEQLGSGRTHSSRGSPPAAQGSPGAGQLAVQGSCSFPASPHLPAPAPPAAHTAAAGPAPAPAPEAGEQQAGGASSGPRRSNFRGVFWDRKNHRWRAQVGHNNKKIFLGYFAVAAAAARAYDQKLVQLHGTLAKTNFPMEDYAEDLALHRQLRAREDGAELLLLPLEELEAHLQQHLRELLPSHQPSLARAFTRNWEMVEQQQQQRSGSGSGSQLQLTPQASHGTGAEGGRGSARGGGSDDEDDDDDDDDGSSHTVLPAAAAAAAPSTRGAAERSRLGGRKRRWSDDGGGSEDSEGAAAPTSEHSPSSRRRRRDCSPAAVPEQQQQQQEEGLSAQGGAAAGDPLEAPHGVAQPKLPGLHRSSSKGRGSSLPRQRSHTPSPVTPRGRGSDGSMPSSGGGSGRQPHREPPVSLQQHLLTRLHEQRCHRTTSSGQSMDALLAAAAAAAEEEEEVGTHQQQEQQQQQQQSLPATPQRAHQQQQQQQVPLAPIAARHAPMAPPPPLTAAAATGSWLHKKPPSGMARSCHVITDTAAVLSAILGPAATAAAAAMPQGDQQQRPQDAAGAPQPCGRGDAGAPAPSAGPGSPAGAAAAGTAGAGAQLQLQQQPALAALHRHLLQPPTCEVHFAEALDLAHRAGLDQQTQQLVVLVMYQQLLDLQQPARQQQQRGAPEARPRRAGCPCTPRSTSGKTRQQARARARPPAKRHRC